MLYIASFSTKLHGQSNDSLETRYVWLLLGKVNSIYLAFQVT